MAGNVMIHYNWCRGSSHLVKRRCRKGGIQRLGAAGTLGSTAEPAGRGALLLEFFTREKAPVLMGGAVRSVTRGWGASSGVTGTY